MSAAHGRWQHGTSTACRPRAAIGQVKSAFNSVCHARDWCSDGILPVNPTNSLRSNRNANGVHRCARDLFTPSSIAAEAAGEHNHSRSSQGRTPSCLQRLPNWIGVYRVSWKLSCAVKLRALQDSEDHAPAGALEACQGSQCPRATASPPADSSPFQLKTRIAPQLAGYADRRA